MNETRKDTGTPVNGRRGADVESNIREPSGGTPAQGEQPSPPAQQAKGTEPVEESQLSPPSQEAQELAAARAELARLQLELEASRKRVDELARAYQALQQDREEFKARLSRERERMIDVEKGNVALSLLEGIDELDRCLGASASDTSPLAEGVRLIRDKLLAKVQAVGIERLELVGKPFDPNLADAVDMEITPRPEEDQQVVAELHAGYRLKERVIRPARVKVAKYVKPAEA